MPLTPKLQAERDARRRLLRRTAIALPVLMLAFGLFGAWANHFVISSTEGRHYHDYEQIPERSVALVLGTSKWIGIGKRNPYFMGRVEAAAKLFNAGKVGHIIVSGDNSHDDYNEPRDMYLELVAMGIPADNITLDYAGFRTLDSVVRCQEVFGQTSVIIVSQRYHNFRALFIAQTIGLDAVAFDAPEDETIRGISHPREWLARVRTIFDLYVFHTQPHFVGRKEHI